MHLTLHSDYSLRVLIYLASLPDRLVSTEEISESFQISRNHLVKVVLQLSKRGYVAVRRGRNGGIQLAKKPDQIRIGDLVRAMEPDVHLAECFDPVTNRCPLIAICGLKGALYGARQAFFDALNKHTLATVTNSSMSRMLRNMPALEARPG